MPMGSFDDCTIAGALKIMWWTKQGLVILWVQTRAVENTLAEIYMAIVAAQKLKPASSIVLIQSKISSWEIVRHPSFLEHLF